MELACCWPPGRWSGIRATIPIQTSRCLRRGEKRLLKMELESRDGILSRHKCPAQMLQGLKQKISRRTARRNRHATKPGTNPSLRSFPRIPQPISAFDAKCANDRQPCRVKIEASQNPLKKRPCHGGAHRAPSQNMSQEDAMGAPASRSPRPVAAKDPPAPLNFFGWVLIVASQKTVANQEAHLVTVRAMGLLQVAAALVKAEHVGHIRCHPMHGSPPLCLPQSHPSSPSR